MAIYVFSTVDTPRLRYALQLIFSDVLGIGVNLTDNWEVFEQWEGPKLEYGHSRIGNELFIKAHKILEETEIKPQPISVEKWNELHIFFQTSSEHSAFPFDPFSASFYLASRYEEYLPFEEDAHGRFEAKQSIAFREGFLQEPLINQFAKLIKQLIEERFPDYSFPEKHYQFTPTIDVDNAFAYKHKEWWRILLSLAKKLTKFQIGQFFRQTQVLLGLTQDPYNSFEKLARIHQETGTKPIYFFLLGDLATYDRGLPFSSKALKKIILNAEQEGHVGIHPSYASNSSEEILKLEIQRLSDITQKPINKSRQHYLKLKFPETYQRLIRQGIKEDYTMGYASQIGFRASICSPFHFYDLENEQMTDLKLYPFFAMDTGLKSYSMVAPEEVMEHLTPIVEKIRDVNGLAMVLSHNDSIHGKEEWSGWENVYENVVKSFKA